MAGAVRSPRSVVAGIALAAVAAAPAPAGVNATSTPATRATGTELSLVSASQRKILQKDALEVRVRAPGDRLVKLRGYSGSRRVAKPRVLGLDAGEEARIELPLTASGERRLARCEEQELVVKLRVSLAGDPIGDGDDGRTRLTRPLQLDAPECTHGVAAGDPYGTRARPTRG
jgi:hypothetical protein